jgi:hypothetical protein
MPRFCHSCGAALAQDGAFCSACGAPTAKEEPPAAGHPPQQFSTPLRPSKPASLLEELSHLGRLVTVGIVLLILFIAWVSSRDANQTPARSSEAPAGQAPKTHRIGEDFSVGYWSYRCDGATWQSMIPSLGAPEAPDAAFLVVDLYIRNNDRTASTLPPLKLVDAQGREYDESSKGTFMPGAFDVLKELNPGVSSRGYAIFDAPRGQYTLKVSGGLESGEHALVDLSPLAESPAATATVIATNEAKPSPAPPKDSTSAQHEAAPTPEPIHGPLSFDDASDQCMQIIRQHFPKLSVWPGLEDASRRLYQQNGRRLSLYLEFDPGMGMGEGNGTATCDVRTSRAILKSIQLGIIRYDYNDDGSVAQKSGWTGWQNGMQPIENKTSQSPPGESIPTQQPPQNSTPDGSRTPSSANATASQLQFESGIRVIVHIVSISRQRNGDFTFRGTLLLPVALAGGASLEQGTELTGSGTESGGHVTVAVTGLTLQRENYTLQQAASGANKKAGSGPAIELDPGKVIEVWFASDSVYAKTAGEPN